MATKKNEIIGNFIGGSYSSTFTFYEQLAEEIRIRKRFHFFRCSKKQKFHIKFWLFASIHQLSS